jgi:hypothetical protein
MHFFGRNLEGFPKWLVIFVTILLIASGLCGIQLAVLSLDRGNTSALEGVFALTGVVELLAMAVAAGGIALVLIIWIIFGILRKPFPGRHGDNLGIVQSGDDKQNPSKDSQ